MTPTLHRCYIFALRMPHDVGPELQRRPQLVVVQRQELFPWQGVSFREDRRGHHGDDDQHLEALFFIEKWLKMRRKR